MFGICNLAIIPLRFEPNDRSEIVSQVLFGEDFEILEKQKQWSRIKIHFDVMKVIDSKYISQNQSSFLTHQFNQRFKPNHQSNTTTTKHQYESRSNGSIINTSFYI
jgi:uncharacterized protein YgiM (DUF1202 family)